MRIWISIAGWRLTRIFTELFLACVVLHLAGTGAFAGEKVKGAGPDMEMIEYLGTFETAGGKMIDPLKLPAVRSQDDKATTRPAPKGTDATKTDRNTKDDGDD